MKLNLGRRHEDITAQTPTKRNSCPHCGEQQKSFRSQIAGDATLFIGKISAFGAKDTYNMNHCTLFRDLEGSKSDFGILVGSNRLCGRHGNVT